MTDAEIRKRVIRTLEEAFAGPTGLVGEKSLLLRENEGAAVADSPYIHNGLFTRLLDSFFDFVLDAFSRKFVCADANEAALLVSSFWTIRSAFNLFWDRYYSNSVGVLRTGLESVFLLTAERKGCIDRSKLITLVSSSVSASGTDRDKLKKKARRLNAQVYRHLIGDQSGLPKSHQDTMQVFVDQLHESVHYAFPAYAQLLRQSAETGGMSIFPESDDNAAGKATVAFMATAWTYLHVLRSFLAEPELPDWYQNRLNVLDDSFRHASSTIWSKKLQRAWGAFLKAHY